MKIPYISTKKIIQNTIYTHFYMFLAPRGIPSSNTTGINFCQHWQSQENSIRRVNASVLPPASSSPRENPRVSQHMPLLPCYQERQANGKARTSVILDIKYNRVPLKPRGGEKWWRIYWTNLGTKYKNPLTAPSRQKYHKLICWKIFPIYQHLLAVNTPPQKRVIPLWSNYRANRLLL